LFYCTPDPIEILRYYAKVNNTHDVEKIVSLYAEDAIFEVDGLVSLKGINQIRDITRYDSVLNVQIIIDNIRRQADTVYCHLSETNDWLKVSEIDTAFYTVAFVFEKGLIKSINAKIEPKTAEAFRQVLSSFMTWAKVEKPKILQEMMPEGKFIYTAVNAGKNLELLKTWKAIQEE
jgi:hypothetical protein